MMFVFLFLGVCEIFRVMISAIPCVLVKEKVGFCVSSLLERIWECNDNKLY
jgi:hypothetical protein